MTEYYCLMLDAGRGMRDDGLCGILKMVDNSVLLVAVSSGVCVVKLQIVYT